MDGGSWFGNYQRAREGGLEQREDFRALQCLPIAKLTVPDAHCIEARKFFSVIVDVELGVVEIFELSSDAHMVFVWAASGQKHQREQE